VLEATRVVDFPRNQTLVAGQPIRLPCSVKHDKDLHVTVLWMVDGQPISDDKLKDGYLRIDKDNTLVIREPRKYDSGVYKCVAQSSLDTVEREARLVIKDVPEPPYNAYLSCGENQRNVAVDFHYNEPVRHIFICGENLR
jgi:hypothetical protein